MEYMRESLRKEEDFAIFLEIVTPEVRSRRSPISLQFVSWTCTKGTGKLRANCIGKGSSLCFPHDLAFSVRLWTPKSSKIIPKNTLLLDLFCLSFSRLSRWTDDLLSARSCRSEHKVKAFVCRWPVHPL